MSYYEEIEEEHKWNVRMKLWSRATMRTEAKIACVATRMSN